MEICRKATQERRRGYGYNNLGSYRRRTAFCPGPRFSHRTPKEKIGLRFEQKPPICTPESDVRGFLGDGSAYRHRETINGHKPFDEEEGGLKMDTTMLVRIVAGVLFVIVLSVLIARRKKKAA